ncbi:MAG: hypothetical protein LUF35_11010 [Lachnospiraceae bacterium]|nr:hypothetical protein [Lachnospiraceae bacterium]
MKKIILTIFLALGLAAASWWMVQTFDGLDGKLSMATASQTTMEVETEEEESDTEAPVAETSSRQTETEAAQTEQELQSVSSPEEISEETETPESEEVSAYASQTAETESGADIESVSETETDTESVSDTTSGTQEETSSNPAAPVITLNCTEAYLTIGDTFDIRDYVENVSDDVDNVYELYRRISVSGDYDLNKSGRYTLTITVADTSGNVSAPCYLTLIVAAG